MRRALRLALALVGLALAVYAGATLTGGRLGTPPWSERWSAYTPSEFILQCPPRESDARKALFTAGRLRATTDGIEHLEAVDERDELSLAAIVVGLFILAWAWPERVNPR